MQGLVDACLLKAAFKAGVGIADGEHVYRDAEALPGEKLREKETANGNAQLGRIPGQYFLVDNFQDLRFHPVDFQNIGLHGRNATV